MGNRKCGHSYISCYSGDRNYILSFPIKGAYNGVAIQRLPGHQGPQTARCSDTKSWFRWWLLLSLTGRRF